MAKKQKLYRVIFQDSTGGQVFFSEKIIKSDESLTELSRHAHIASVIEEVTDETLLTDGKPRQFIHEVMEEIAALTPEETEEDK